MLKKKFFGIMAFLAVGLLALTLVFTACEGPMGPQGEKGEQGEKGDPWTGGTDPSGGFELPLTDVNLVIPYLEAQSGGFAVSFAIDLPMAIDLWNANGAWHRF